MRIQSFFKHIWYYNGGEEGCAFWGEMKIESAQISRAVHDECAAIRIAVGRDKTVKSMLGRADAYPELTVYSGPFKSNAYGLRSINEAKEDTL